MKNDHFKNQLLGHFRKEVVLRFELCELLTQLDLSKVAQIFKETSNKLYWI